MSIFNMILIIHILFGAICLITGIVAMLAQKKKGKHTEWGEIYHASYVVITITAIILSLLNWDKIAYLFYVAIISYAFAIYGYLARKKRWKNWLGHHIRGMLGSYIGAVTNIGMYIPVINLLPPIWFWFLPTLIGIPLVSSVSKRYKKQR
ncbi:DUF2306 domain-containing protein [Bacillus paramycoides]|uniref:DUF2306 domain-containing protein n=1 Tax=Bacillus paramycoides TaxID=2026194 RepID=A0A1J9UHG9_9BACI|nr:DUF2306 domain-containing protein [Bacillus paramycoides]OJD78126.1 DUF2306 domain-containing protein [Bacillus paramycoides]